MHKSICVDADDITVIILNMLNGYFYIGWSDDLKRFKNCHKGERVFIVVTELGL